MSRRGLPITDQTITMPPTKPLTKPPRPAEQPLGNSDLYRCRLTCKLGRDACEGRGVPEGVRREDWMAHLMFSAIDDLALAMEKR
jgi:hypothetical protein